ncbi:hypothetical protein OG474_27475 [Kribbella sp. NBC_01505]|uniref:hypothetical protein n=1 Tax=Kribbella sp. NBC_01505 TaxID=2903580 RepID=UPI00386DB83C
MGVVASLALLVLLGFRWLTTWNESFLKPPRTYGGLTLTNLLSNAGSPLGDSGTWLFRIYLLLALVCLVLPATIAAVAASCAGFATTVLLIIVKPDPTPTIPYGVAHADWSALPALAVVLWVVAVCVSFAGWSTQPARTTGAPA